MKHAYYWSLGSEPDPLVRANQGAIWAVWPKDEPSDAMEV